MSSPDPSRRAVAAALLAAGLLAGCTNVQPLYGSLGGKTGVGQTLKSVDIALTDSRISQHLRNELIFAFTGGGDPDKPVYRLNLRVTDVSVPVGVERLEDIPAAYLLQLQASYTLVEIATGTTLTNGTSFANASYDFSQQRFANVRAQRDAENRAANLIAADIRTKIAAFFATRA
jgi:LPS-assembly lipoprotein